MMMSLFRLSRQMLRLPCRLLMLVLSGLTMPPHCLRMSSLTLPADCLPCPVLALLLRYFCLFLPSPVRPGYPCRLLWPPFLRQLLQLPLPLRRPVLRLFRLRLASRLTCPPLPRQRRPQRLRLYLQLCRLRFPGLVRGGFLSVFLAAFRVLISGPCLSASCPGSAPAVCRPSPACPLHHLPVPEGQVRDLPEEGSFHRCLR